MNEAQRQAIRRQVQAALRRQALESVQQNVAREKLLHDISIEHSIPADFELRQLVANASREVTLDLQQAYDRSAVASWWERLGHTRYVIIPLLVLLLSIGALLRFDRIAQQSQWMDEYWAVYLATGRGNEIFGLPEGKILQPPPPSNFSNAPPWWHIWTGITSVTHPPLYYLFLRWWIDLFGDSDFSTRALSACFALTSIVLFFDVVRRSSNSTAQAFCASAMLTLVPWNIYFSQQARPYTLLILLALCACDLLLVIENTGPSWGKTISLGAAFFCLAMTHYFSAGVFVAFAIYSLVRLRGPGLRAMLCAMMVSLALFAILWTPMFLKSTMALVDANKSLRRAGFSQEESVLNLPRRLLFDNGIGGGSEIGSGFWVTLSFAATVYLLPLLRLKRHPQLLLWWLWTVCVVGPVLVLDLRQHTNATSVLRYVVLASPGVFAIFATPLPTRFGKWVPVAFVLAAGVGGLVEWQEGPPGNVDTKQIAQWVKRDVGPGDVVMITAMPDILTPSFSYIAIGHYLGDWQVPVVFLSNPDNRELADELKRFQHVWVLGTESPGFLANWKLRSVRKIDQCFIHRAIPGC